MGIKESGIFAGKSGAAKVFLAAILLFGSMVRSEASFYPQEVQCGSIDCFAIISGKNLDNISFFKKSDGSGFRVDFRDKSRPLKNFYYDGNVDDAKAILATLLSAKSSVLSIKVYVINGDYQSNNPTRYQYVTLAD